MLAALNARFGRPLGAHDLEDLTQDVLVALWRALPGFAGLASLESWAFRAVHRALVARLHRGPAMQTVADSERVEREVLVEPSADEAVFQALERVEPQARRVIELKHFEELTFEEIGGALSVSPNTAKSWYYRSIKELKRMLERSRRSER
jgi:RNA polymerase sigma-70 factor (ECF subfamily)